MIGTPLLKRAYNLGLKAVPNFEALPAAVIEYYEQHLDLIPQALARGFVVEAPAGDEQKPLKPSPAPKPLLAHVGTIEAPAVAEFDGAEKFVPGQTVDGVKFYRSFGHNFTKLLRKKEVNVPAATLSVDQLTRRSRNWPIIEERAGADHEAAKKKIATALAHVFYTLKMADKRKWYVFYVLDEEGTLWAVFAHWFDWHGVAGWGLEASSVGLPFDWREGGLVVSPQILELSGT
ncbi:MAG: hypothetical protein KGI78_03115 [Patescibacteria group bacterium]|nr:hypothetical protein [Patescibacteria group bacterium]MDE1944412.1 hypothetical protein [Patescibacteria group bacterium]MDE1945375.1 hypothetical protein [Patescibacteria group bacterium]MDE2057820.1 hypothetical protein [Patescibacteria group bacterium]